MAKTTAPVQPKDSYKKKLKVDNLSGQNQLASENAVGAHKMLIDSCLLSFPRSFLTYLPCSLLTPHTRLPNEMIIEVLCNLAEIGRDSLLAARSVCHQWNSLINSAKFLSTKFPLLTIDRLVVTFDEQKKCYELRWCNYKKNKSRVLFFTPTQVKSNRMQLFLAFNRLDIRRIVFQGLPSGSLNDDLIRFVCRQFSHCRRFRPNGLSIKNSSLKKLSSAGLYNLMAMCGKTLETFQACKLNGLKPDSITDTHLSLLNLTHLRSLAIESVKFSASQKCLHLLQIGDETLKKLIHRRNYPSLKLEKCRITARMVGQYMESWLAKESAAAAVQPGEALANVCSHMFVLKECPAVSNAQFERECRRRSLDYSSPGRPLQLPSASMTATKFRAVNYSIHRVESIKEFMVTLCSANSKNPFSSPCDSKEYSLST